MWSVTGISEREVTEEKSTVTIAVEPVTESFKASPMDIEEVKSFWDADWDKQMKLVPTINDGHSGNTFGCACKLAVLYLESPELVARIHGSLSPLVGSEAFGDIKI